MMIVIDYRLDEYMANTLSPKGLESISLQDMTASFFLGDVLFRIDDAIFDTPWGLVSIFDFAIALYDTPRLIMDDEQRIVTFLETSENLVFRRIEQVLEISATYTKASGKIYLDELKLESYMFLQGFIQECIIRWPALALNAVIIQIRHLLQEDCTSAIEPALRQYF